MKFEKIVLGYYGALFIVFGLAGLAVPDVVAGLVHLNFKSNIGYMDFVAMYGGLFIGVGGFMLYCLKHSAQLGLVCVLFTMGFMLVARGCQYLNFGAADLVQYIYLGGELFTVVLVGCLLYFGKSGQEKISSGSIK